MEKFNLSSRRLRYLAEVFKRFHGINKGELDKGYIKKKLQHNNWHKLHKLILRDEKGEPVTKEVVNGLKKLCKHLANTHALKP